MTAVAPASHPAGPKGTWFLGHMRPFADDRLRFVTNAAREFGDFVPFRLGPNRIYLVSDPALIEEILVTKNKSFIKHFGLRYFSWLIGRGLLTSEGDFWRRQRRLIQPAFHPRAIESYGETMVQLTEELLEGWYDGREVDLHEQMTHLTLAVACKTLFNADVRSDTSDVIAALRTTLQATNYRFSKVWVWPLWVPTPMNLRTRRALNRLNAIIEKLIDERRRRSAEQSNDLLATLLHLRDETDGKGMDARQLRDEVMTLFLAGHGTTANALSWTWHLLMEHPEAEARLHAELASVLNGRLPTVADVPNLPYTRNIISESMRLYPPAYILGREAAQSVEVGPYRIQRGETVMMSQWVVHRDPRWFPEPEQFRPERWSEPGIAALPKYAYFPFGGGPRVCIGNTFALLELPLILATIAQRYRFRPVPGHLVRPWPAVTLRPEFGIKAFLQRRA